MSVSDDDFQLDLPGDQAPQVARDAALVAELRRVEFAGPRYDVFENDFAAAALPWLSGMLSQGSLITESQKKWKGAGYPFGVAEGDRHLLRESKEQRDILAVGILVETLRSFRKKALIEGGGDPLHQGENGPGCLMTYFIGCCAWEFRPQYMKWRRERQRVADAEAALLDPEAFVRSVAGGDGNDLESGGAVLDMLRAQPRPTRAVLALVLQGYTQLEIADRLQISRGAVANSIYRFRQKVLRAAHSGKVSVPAALDYASRRAQAPRRKRCAVSVPVFPARVAGLVGGGAALGLSAFVHAPWWVYLGGVLLVLVPTALPQESEHRRDFYRDYFRHREQMVRIRQEPLRRPASLTAHRELDRPEPSGEGTPDG
ncbi:RNA polymerase sigma factor [Streptomyces hygroscopicus]|uniref:RNA polymerase sigma factor n=1 Tax=Streptomyces hygroscopicus TaxID=1912 RepID=UPI000B0A6CDB|nr:sigma factor-like helix-turn-helix DNA-binding protein [Streptomyces hygroscopicus]